MLPSTLTHRRAACRREGARARCGQASSPNRGQLPWNPPNAPGVAPTGACTVGKPVHAGSALGNRAVRPRLRPKLPASPASFCPFWAPTRRPATGRPRRAGLSPTPTARLRNSAGDSPTSPKIFSQVFLPAPALPAFLQVTESTASVTPTTFRLRGASSRLAGSRAGTGCGAETGRCAC